MGRSLVRGRTLGAAGAALLFCIAVYAGCKERDRERQVPSPNYGPARPVLTVLLPDAAFLGGGVTLAGKNFAPLAADNIISFNGGITPALLGDATSLTCIVPFGASSGPVTVTVAGLQSNPLDFTIIGGPQVISLVPEFGPQGTLVTIDGANFAPIPEDNQIFFDFDGVSGVATPALTATRFRLTCYAPAGASTGAVAVRVGGLDSNRVPYTYTTVKLTDVVPRSGFVADSIQLLGEHFSPTPTENIIRFNGTVAPCLSSTPTTILTEVPPGATGGHVTVETDRHESNGIFFCVWTPPPAAPSISDVVPPQGAYGDPVTIQGSAFAPSTTDNEVRFNGVLAQVTAATATALDVVVPDGSTTGPVTVEKGPDSAASPADFTVTSPPPPAPVLDRLNPTAAIQGTSIVIEGSDFHPVAANNIVRFTADLAEVIAASPTSLLVKVPFTESGVVTVRAGDQVSNGLGFVFQGAPPGLSTFPFFGKQIQAPSDSVTFVVDLSLSMDVSFGSYVDRFGQGVTGTRLDVTRDRLAYSISELPSYFLFNVVEYAGDPDRTICADQRFWQPTSQQATPANKLDAIAWLDSRVTWLWTATTMAVEAALQRDAGNRTICLITDGRWTCPLTETNADQVCRMFNANPQDAAIHTVAIQVSGGFANLLRDISVLSGGTFTSLAPPLGWPD